MSNNSVKTSVKKIRAKSSAKKESVSSHEKKSDATANPIIVINESTILNHLSQECNHRSTYNYGRGIGGTNSCETACHLIVQGVTGGQQFSNGLIDTFLKRTVRPLYDAYYYRESCCLKKIPDTIKNTISTILTVSVPNDDILLQLIDKPIFDSVFCAFVKNNQHFDKFGTKFIKEEIP